MKSKAKVIKSDLSYLYQLTDIDLDIQSPEELDSLVDALQSDSNEVVVLRSRKKDITVSIYLRFRE